MSPYTYQKTKGGKQETVNEILVQSDLLFEWVNDECPDEKIVVPWAMVGQQADASQSFGSGLTYVYRYFLLKYFGVSTVEDDPDNWRSKQRDAGKLQRHFCAYSRAANPNLLLIAFKKESQKSQYLQGLPGLQHEVFIRVVDPKRKVNHMDMCDSPEALNNYVMRQKHLKTIYNAMAYITADALSPGYKKTGDFVFQPGSVTLQPFV